VDTWQFSLRGETLAIPTADTAEQAVDLLWQLMGLDERAESP
jgi:hypothetical protein